MPDRLRNLLFPTVILAIVGSLWAMAHSKSLEQQLSPGTFPAADAAHFDAAASIGDPGTPGDDFRVAGLPLDDL